MKVLILSGGQGTRAYPHTQLVPKALMPVAGYPVIEQVMRIYASHGRREFVLALGHMKDDIIRYARSRAGTYSIECVDTGATTDTGGRVRQCLELLGERFHCTYVDGLGDVDISALEAFHDSAGGAATITTVPLRSQYGIVNHEGDRITDFVEKPVLRDYWINAGFFVFDRDMIAATPGDNLERDVLPALATSGSLRMFRHTGFWRSMDTYKDQQELEALWRSHSEAIDRRLPEATAELPSWLAERHATAGLSSR